MRRIGFREAKFTPQGFSLNGKIIKLHGLDRHQTFPWVGQAMPGRVQRQDAKILRHDLHCNIVRTSHYPQSRHFLDCCDEIGLLVLEEIPGWQHIGPLAWQDIAVDNVRRMVRRDWNHPSVILWGVRINESQLIITTSTRAPTRWRTRSMLTRQTGGIRYLRRNLGFRAARRCLHHERLRLAAAQAQPPALPQYGVRRPYLPHQNHR